MQETGEFILNEARSRLDFLKDLYKLSEYLYHETPYEIRNKISSDSNCLSLFLSTLIQSLANNIYWFNGITFQIADQNGEVDVKNVIFKKEVSKDQKSYKVGIYYAVDDGTNEDITIYEKCERKTIIITQNNLAGGLRFEPEFLTAAIVSIITMYVKEENLLNKEGQACAFLSRMLMSYHPYTYNHSVINLYLMDRIDELLRKGGLQNDKRRLNLRHERFRNAILLHDIGKIFWPISILDAVGGKSPLMDEYIKYHTIIGGATIYSFLSEHLSPDTLGLFLSMIIWHHEDFYHKNTYPEREEIIEIFHKFCIPEYKKAEVSMEKKLYVSSMIDEAMKYNPVMGRCTCDICLLRIIDSLSAMTTTREYQVTQFIDDALEQIKKENKYCPLIKDLLHKDMLGYSSGHIQYDRCPRQEFN